VDCYRMRSMLSQDTKVTSRLSPRRDEKVVGIG
jgi:hypothetical protein